MRHLLLVATLIAMPAFAQEPPKPQTLGERLDDIKGQILEDSAPSTTAAKVRLSNNLVHLTDAVMTQAMKIDELQQQVNDLKTPKEAAK